MAMRTCSECGKDVSDQAAACPHCGLLFTVAARGSNWKQRFSTAVEVTKTAASKTVAGVKIAAQIARGTYDTVAPALGLAIDAAGDAVEYAGNVATRRLSEDERVILDTCPVVRQINAERSVFETDPEIFSQLYNVQVRPVVTAAVLGSVGGVMSWNDEFLSRFTRQVFDGKDLVGGFLGDRIASVVGAMKVDLVNDFMDRVPGATVRGGGWLHRVQHGHDLSALATIYREHGSGGLLQGVYHVYGRDFFTPAGIPVLPKGSNEARELLNAWGWNNRDAASLLSVNFLEVMGGMMALVGAFRLWCLARSLYADFRLQDFVSRASAAAEQQDFLTATTLMQEALGMRPSDGNLSIALGTLHQRAGNRLSAHFAFRDATRLLAAGEPTLRIGGAAISLRGIGSGMALATSDSLAKLEQYQRDWFNHVIELTRTGVNAFESVGNSLIERRAIKVVSGTEVLPSRYLSGALNYYLAGQLVGASMFLPDRDAILTRLHRKADEALEAAKERPALADRQEEVAALQRFARAELLPPAPAAV